MNPLPKIRQELGCIFVLSLVIIIAYFNSLKNSFQFDDVNFRQRIWVSNIDEFNKRVKIFSFKSDPNQDQSFSPYAQNLYKIFYKNISTRPIVLFSYALNNTLNKNSTFGFHLANMIFHILNTILVFFIIKLAFQMSGESRRNKTSFAFISSFIFAIHPVFTEAVTYLSARSSELFTFFYLLGVWYFLLLFQAKNRGKIYSSIRIILIILCFYLSLNSKIAAATLPVILILLFIFLICPRKYPKIYQKLTSLPFLAIYFFLLISILFFVTIIPQLDGGKDTYGYFGYFFIQVKVITFYYLKVLLWPINLNLDITYPFTTIQEDPKIAIAAFIELIIFISISLKGGKWAKVCLGWFIFTLAPTSSILPVNDLAVEHRLYLPATIGICPFFALTFQKAPKKIRYVYIIFLLVSFTALTAQRNKIWLNEFSLWKDAVKKSPYSSRPYANLGKAYYDKGEIDLALKYFKKSNELSDLNVTTHYNLGNVYMDKGQLDLSEEEYNLAIIINPDYYAAYFGLGSIQSQTGRLDEAEKNYLTAINIRSTRIAQGEQYPIARINLGEVYGKMGRFKEAIKQSKIALKSIPNSFKAYYNIGTANMKLGNLEKAKKAFLACLKIQPKFKNALFNLAFVYQKLDQFDKSNQYFSKFLEIQKSLPKAYALMGINYAKLNKLDHAIESFKKALELNPNIINARTLLAKILSQKGNNKEAVKQLEIVLKKNPNLNAIRIQLGLMYWKIEGKLDKTRTLFKAALKSSTKTKERTQISYWLEELNKQ